MILTLKKSRRTLAEQDHLRLDLGCVASQCICGLKAMGLDGVSCGALNENIPCLRLLLL